MSNSQQITNNSAKEGRGRIYARITGFIAIFALLASLAIVRDARLFGHTFAQEAHKTAVQIENRGDALVLSTKGLATSVSGYAGEVPVEITVKEGKILSVEPLPNGETPSFFAKTSQLAHAWDGLTLSEAADLHPDAVSGATYSSKALIANVEAAVGYMLDNPVVYSDNDWSLKMIIIIAVILCGGIIPLFLRNKSYRLIQQLLNVAVLGFWGGTFIDYAMMLGFFANGASFSAASVIVCLLLVIGLLYPLFGKQAHYCSWVCPYGALQDLAGKARAPKIKLTAKTVKALDTFRKILWCVLVALLFLGWGVSWIDYEIFTAFIVESASWAVITAGVAFIVLSLFVQRPFCRFVCPTGSLIKSY